jgi:hypothetical protein
MRLTRTVRTPTEGGTAAVVVVVEETVAVAQEQPRR